MSRLLVTRKTVFSKNAGPRCSDMTTSVNFGCLFINPPCYGFAKAECNEKCYYCGHPFMAEVTRSVKEGKPTKECLKYMS